MERYTVSIKELNTIVQYHFSYTVGASVPIQAFLHYTIFNIISVILW